MKRSDGLGGIYLEGNMADEKKAEKEGIKIERTNCDRLELTLVDQTVRCFVRPEDLFAF